MFLRFASLSLFLFLIYSCAQVVQPSGGPVDRKAPVPMTYVPDSAARNVLPARIKINFDEYIQLKELNKNLIISPSLKNPADITATGKTLDIRIKDTLEPNTTYVFDFGNAVTDITEGNPAKFAYVFSTGPEIDTLELSGFVRDAMSNEGEPNFSVFLFRDLSDSVPYKGKPYYQRQTDKDGSFRFSNLKSGTYRVFGIKDANNNFLPDLNEPIAFLAEPFTIESDSTLQLKSFIEAPSKQFLKSTNLPLPGKMELIYSKEVKSLSFSMPDQQKSISIFHKEIGVLKDSITVWYHKPVSDSVFIIAKTENTSDTLDKKLPTEASVRGKGTFGIVRSNLDSKGMIADDYFQLELNLPIGVIDTSKIRLTYPAGSKKIYRLTKDTATFRKLTFEVSVPEDSSYGITMFPGAITAFNGKQADTLKLTVKKRSLSTLGTLKLTVLPPDKDAYVVQILTEKGNIRSESPVSGSGSIIFLDKLEPGQYVARIIHDTNKNGKWDTGNYLKHMQPETVTTLSKKLEVKAGWDLEEKWDVE